MDSFSEKAATELLAAFPAWPALAREERRADGTSYFVLEIPPPSRAHVERGLLTSTEFVFDLGMALSTPTFARNPCLQRPALRATAEPPGRWAD